MGSSVPKAVDVRVISATNMPLQEMIAEKTSGRISITGSMPLRWKSLPFASGKEDIPVLAAFFLKKYSEQYRKSGLKLSDAAMDQLKQHPWPGNIRELEHTIEKAVILSEKEVITIISLSPGSAQRHEARPCSRHPEPGRT